MSSQKMTHEWLLQTKAGSVALGTGTQTRSPTTNSAKIKNYDRAQRVQGPKEIGAPSPQWTCPSKAPLQRILPQDASIQGHPQRGRLRSWVNLDRQSRKEIQRTDKYLGNTITITRIKSQLKLVVSLSFHFFPC